LIVQKLESLLGPDHVVAAEQNSELKLEGVGPLPIAYVRSTEELAEVVRLAASENWAIIPVGGATKLEIGNLPRRADLFVSTSRMNSIPEHPPEDLIATVQAGSTLAVFQETLSRHNQFLPVESPFCERSTMGGLVATACHGPSRLGWGTARDWLIGLRVVTGEGRIAKAGGKVVKNVAGYDLMKLYTGSYGTLAIIAEMSFKLRPRPSAETTLIGLFQTPEQSLEAAQRLIKSQLAPVAIELFGARALRISFPEARVDDGSWYLAARFTGLPEAFKNQRARLSDLWQGLSTDMIEISESSREGWQRAVDFGRYFNHSISLRVSVLPSRLGEMIALLREQLSTVASDYETLIDSGTGIARVFVNAAEEELVESRLQRWRVSVHNLRSFCEREGGSVIMERAPLVMKPKIDAWGELLSAANLMRTIKGKFDPKGILNPGRFVAGI
jgi:glycolate oxidase FAD binding subunit